ncbi:stefin-C-like [Narcine bancroftii]|uniref:stefin-C-like n=1 Tax=Narcine bancroftii TaxID=1343680 RepID=UPI00383168A5
MARIGPDSADGGQFPIVGGFGAPMEATSEIQELADQVKNRVQVVTGKNMEHYQVMQFRSQIVSGTIYLIKVLIGPKDECVHIKVFVSLSTKKEETQLLGMEPGKKLSDPLIPFQG